ncbi:MAG TPA: GH116 family glycosyl hydrolase [Chitinophagaceae bacterium]|nr:GH116 family glycosyl hydrolase [Chitinophagaceae bacterium]
MKEKTGRRSFIKNLGIGGVAATVAPGDLLKKAGKNEAGKGAQPNENVFNSDMPARPFNSVYKGQYLNRVAFPIGGIGAGMYCLEGTGAISHLSVHNKPDVFNEPGCFAAIHVKGVQYGSKILEGPVPDWKKFGRPDAANGAAGTIYGLPRFSYADFETRFPFAIINLNDKDIPLKVTLKGWSPFIPGDADNSSLPAGALEYSFTNNTAQTIEAIFSFNARNFMQKGDQKGSIKKIENGFVLSCTGTKDRPDWLGDFAIYTDQAGTIVDHCWFRGGWFDPLTIAWETIRSGNTKSVDPVDEGAPGASLFVPLSIAPGTKKTVRLMTTWYAPVSEVRIGEEPTGADLANDQCITSDELGDNVDNSKEYTSGKYKSWYSTRFKDIYETSAYFTANYNELYKKSSLFTDAFYASTLPPEVIEAVAANLAIIKSTTVLRQHDGRLWSWEGCEDGWGCCHGSCTHVWNYAQAIPHLFPSLERSLRHTEFCESQNAEGHQTFRASLPIRPVKHDFYAASDGQLGGIMKVHREWRISGNNKWLEEIFPLVKISMDYCIRTWDPRHKGVVEEPHHNTYDIEFWGPDALCTGFYLGALTAMIKMGEFLKEDVSDYKALYDKGKSYMESELYNGEYFFQKIETTGLNAPSPVEQAKKSYGGNYSQEAIDMLEKEGPKYQYGTGCLSDGVLGAWIAAMCYLSDPLDVQKTTNHLVAVHKYNLKYNLSEHANPQRPSYAFGDEGGLLLCSWPKGGRLSLPFVYSDEVWTGIEYQVASHLMLMGKVKEGLDIVRTCRKRYDGKVRNPFDEYECGHWYARALSSYGLLQGLTGVQYDAVDKTLYIDSKVGDFKSFLSAETGFGTVSLNGNKPSLKVYNGTIPVNKVIVSGKETNLA